MNTCLSEEKFSCLFVVFGLSFEIPYQRLYYCFKERIFSDLFDRPKFLFDFFKSFETFALINVQRFSVSWKPWILSFPDYWLEQSLLRFFPVLPAVFQAVFCLLSEFLQTQSELVSDEQNFGCCTYMWYTNVF